VLRWLADENFNNDILRALFRKNSGIDVVRAQDAGLTGIDDEALLAWAAEQNRVLLTHDVSR
jgi:predicted nuclease of predicted toxin-antitoxin system